MNSAVFFSALKIYEIIKIWHNTSNMINYNLKVQFKIKIIIKILHNC